MVRNPVVATPTIPGVYLYWIPLGAGANVVRISGRIFEGLAALIQKRARRALYHSALVAVTTDAPFVIEMTPVPDSNGRADRGVVAEGTLGRDGVFAAREVLAKHDEKYMPPEVADALKKAGHWKDGATPPGERK